MSRFSFVTIVMSAALAVAAAAESATIRIQGSSPVGYQVRAISIAYDDLNLATADGAAALYQRLETASHIVCGEKMAQHTNSELTPKFAVCRKRAISDAVARLDAPELTKLASAK